MPKIIAITNQKGGVGKTTTAINLAASLGYLGKAVLLIDADAQGNSTSGLGVNKKEVKVSFCDVLYDPQKVNDAIIKTEFKNLSLIPFGSAFLGANDGLCSIKEPPKYRLKIALECIDAERLKPDYIIIDCPPAINLLTENALVCSTHIIVPIQCEYYALEGLTQLINSVRKIKMQYNGSLKLLGVLFTMYNKRLKLTTQVENEVKKYLKDKVFKTVIPRNVRLSESPSFGKPVLYFDKFSPGAVAYLSLAKEVLAKN